MHSSTTYVVYFDVILVFITVFILVSRSGRNSDFILGNAKSSVFIIARYLAYAHLNLLCNL